MFEDFELNPIAMAGGLLGGVLSIMVQSKVETSFLLKALTFLISAVVCYFVTDKLINK